MHHSHLSTFADRAIRLEADHFGSPCLKVQESPQHDACAPGCILSVHDAAPNDPEGMKRLRHAVDAFNAAMDGATLLPVYPARDAEHAASPAGRLAAEIEGGDPLRLANREKHREADQAGDQVREREDVGALS